MSSISHPITFPHKFQVWPCVLMPQPTALRKTLLLWSLKLRIEVCLCGGGLQLDFIGGCFNSNKGNKIASGPLLKSSMRIEKTCVVDVHPLSNEPA